MLACYLKNLALFGTRKCLEGSLTFRGFASLSKDVATGVNILKGGTDPPLKPDEEYPDWLWELAEPQPTLFELRRKYEAAGKDISNMEINEVCFPYQFWSIRACILACVWFLRC
eukprot:jgi/Botrbrau1/10318/Bobra.0120s0031.1